MRISRFFAPALVALSLLALPALASAGTNSQNGADMVIINPGGGVAANGSDGVQPVFNGAYGYGPSGVGQSVSTNGADQQFYKNTGQWCCSTGSGPNINVGGMLVGNSNVAGRSSSTSESWTSVEILSTTGSAIRIPAGETTLPASPPSGSGTASIRYTYTTGGLDYIVVRDIRYRFPSPYYTETYTFTIPDGNTSEVKFYQGGDAAPGDDDSGVGMMTTSPNRTLYEINENSGIFIAYAETGAVGSAFDYWFVGSYSTPRSTYISGGNLNNDVQTSSHDAGLNMQWNLGSSPGTYTRSMNTMVAIQGVNLEVGFSNEQVASGGTTNLEIQMVNTTPDPGTGLSYSYTLPAGLTVNGAESNTCGGTLTVVGTTISISGVDVNSGANCLVTVPVTAPDGRYVVNNQDFTVGGGLEAGYGSTAVTFGNVNFDLDITKSGTGTGAVTSSPAGINCGADCTESYAADTLVTLTAAADSGSNFAGWTGDAGACGSSTTCAVTMDQARTINAEFALPVLYALNITKSGAGTGTVTSSPAGIDCGSDCSENVAENTAVTLTAADGPNSQFVKWTGDYGACTDTNPVCIVTMDQARTIDAEFLSTVRKLTVTKTGTGSGTVKSNTLVAANGAIDCGSVCEEDYSVGAQVTLEATAAAGSTFAGWSGDCSGSSTCTVTMDQARNVTAQFTKDTPPPPSSQKLTVEKTDGGSVTSDPQGIDCGSVCSFDFPAGSKVKLLAKPAAGYRFSSWEGACASQGATCEVEMSEAKTAKALFVRLTPPKLEIQMQAGKQNVKGGQKLPVTINVENTGEETAADASVCFNIPNGFAFVTATKPYTLKGRVVCWKLGDLQGTEVQTTQSKQVKVTLKALSSVKSGTVNLSAAAKAENTENKSEVKAKTKTKVKVKKSKKKPKPVTG